MKKLTLALMSLGFIGILVGVGIFLWVLFYYGDDLPDYTQLKNYEPPIVTRVYASGGNLMAEFATEKRVFVPIETVPDMVIHAFLATEDQHFFTHPGIDFQGVIRAIITNIQNMGTGRRPVGASTITQQVAKNFLLTNEVSYERKIKEALLAFRIERAFSKYEILELYLNEIYLGRGSYGVAAAALEYFNKTLDELTIEEAAYLAALPKAPNNYQPNRDYEAAIARRNAVLDRMAEEDDIINDYTITAEQAEQLKKTPLEVTTRDRSQFISAPYFAEEVRRELAKLYGDDSLYEGGMIVHASVDAELQELAEKTLRDGLVTYDRRHGWHSKPLAVFDTLDDWQKKLGEVDAPYGIGEWQKAVVLKSGSRKAEIGLNNGEKGIITYDTMKWAAERINDFKTGNAPGNVYDVITKGDVILVEKSDQTDGETPVYHLRQIPEVQGGMVVLDPHTGRVLALVGGFSQARSEFNRATQALRQPGSAFKPIVYLSALENGFTPATLVLDAPFVLDQGSGMPKWRPQNYSRAFYGPTPLRIGIEKSRNLMTVRLANYIGMEKVAEMTKRLGIQDDLPQVLSMAIGAGETTLLKMASAYATIANGGKKITPTFIDRVQDRFGKTVFKHDTRECKGCGPLISWEEQPTPIVPDPREQLYDPRIAYQMTSIMEGVVQRGTGVRLRDLNRPIAGKTGTTNDSKDTWFIGFTPDLVVGVYVGFDQPRPLGNKETGSRVSAPIVKSFMKEALENEPVVPFRVPDGVRRVRINAEDGTRAEPGDERVIWEAFIAGTEPTDEAIIFDGETIRKFSETPASSGKEVDIGTGGIY